ncbi:hypothetical protein [Paenibacillus sp. FSL M8-0212]|uniref:hypothetical protein n=1 Tax=unclassified Paenibacillus TaxID=185978 RepID=UPI0030F71320
MDKGTILVLLRSMLGAMDVKLTAATDDTITAMVNGKTITLKSNFRADPYCWRCCRLL